MNSKHALAAMAGLLALSGGGYSSPTRPDRSFYRQRPEPTYSSPPSGWQRKTGWQRKPGTGKRWYMKRKYVRRRSGYFMHKAVAQ
jgi:hypothetical protein